MPCGKATGWKKWEDGGLRGRSGDRLYAARMPVRTPRTRLVLWPRRAWFAAATPQAKAEAWVRIRLSTKATEVSAPVPFTTPKNDSRPSRLADVDGGRQSVCPRGRLRATKGDPIPPAIRPAVPPAKCPDARCRVQVLRLRFLGSGSTHFALQWACPSACSPARPRPRFAVVGAQRRLKGVVPHALSPRGETQGQQGSERGQGFQSVKSWQIGVDSKRWSGVHPAVVFEVIPLFR